MNHDLTIIRSFAAARHRRRLVGLLAKRVLRLAVVFGAASALLHLLFAVIPYTFLILLWDACTVVALLFFIGILVDTLLIHRPSIISTLRQLEQNASVTLPHPLPALALELSRSNTLDNELYDETCRQAVEHHAVLRGTRFFDRRFTKSMILHICIVVLFLTFHLPYKSQLHSYWRLPFGSMGKHQLTVTPGSVRLPRGGSVVLKLQAQGTVTAPSCRVHITSLEQNHRHSRRLYPDSLGFFSTRFDSVTTSFTYTFVYGTVTCDVETVTVVQPPLIRALQVTLMPPPYTGHPKRALPEGRGDFTTYQGTQAHVTIASSPLKRALLLYGTDTIPFTVTDTTATCSLAVNAGGSYTFSLTDTFEQTSDSLPNYAVSVLVDEPPTVRLLRRGINKPLEPQQQETLLVEATDDLGIRTLSLQYYRAGEQQQRSSINLSPARPEQLVQRQIIWKLSRLSLYPGDTVFYWARTGDTRSPGTPHYARSDTFFFRIPSFDEIHRTMARRDAAAKERITASKAHRDELMKHVEQLRKATSGSKKQPGWEEKQLAEKIESLMKAQADSLQESLKELEENVRQLRNEGMLDEEIARKMDDIRKTMEELIEQYGDSLLFNRNDRGEITMNDLRKAVDKLKTMLPELSERLDNTLQFLEALKHDRELAALAQRAEKLAREQLQLAEQSPADPATAKREKDLLDRIDKLKKDISSTLEESPEDTTAMQRLDSLATAMNEQLAQKKPPQQSNMRQMSAALASVAQQLHQKTDAFRQEQLEALRNQLLDLAGGTISLSQWQQQLRQLASSGSGTTDENTVRSNALEQQALHEALSHLETAMDSLPLLAPQLRQQLRSDINAAQRSATSAIQSMGAGDGSFGMQLSEQALNRLSGKLLDIADALQGNNSQGSCNSPGGMQESLRKMSGQQAAVNSATASLLRSLMQGQQGKNGGNKQGGNGKGNEAARKEAQEAQQRIADDLKELGEKFGDANGEGMRKRIQQLEEEARSLSRMLNEPREEVTERQDRFLARMLQSALSLHREEEGKEERTSTAAEIMFTPSAGTLTSEAKGTVDAFQQLRRSALRDGNYPLSYRKSINSYFDSLGVIYLRESNAQPSTQE